MNFKKITNPVYLELLKLKLIKKKNIIKISNQCRDANIPVYQDKISKIIFLEKYKFNLKKYYKYKNVYKKIKNKVFKKIDIKKKIYIEKLKDDSRRLIQFKKICKNKKILDFGCGWGDFIVNLKNTKKKYAYEIRKECITHLKKNKIKIIKNLETNNEKFDIITMFHTLEHIPSQISCLKMLKNKLHPNGKIIIEVPHANDVLISRTKLSKYLKFIFIEEHLIIHTTNSLKKLLKYCGFKNIKIEYFQRHNLNNFIFWTTKGKPGGHNLLNIVNRQTNIKYDKYLVKNKITDTLIASANS